MWAVLRVTTSSPSEDESVKHRRHAFEASGAPHPCHLVTLDLQADANTGPYMPRSLGHTYLLRSVLAAPTRNGNCWLVGKKKGNQKEDEKV